MTCRLSRVHRMVRCATTYDTYHRHTKTAHITTQSPQSTSSGSRTREASTVSYRIVSYRIVATAVDRRQQDCWHAQQDGVGEDRARTRADAHGHRVRKSRLLNALLLIARSTRRCATLPRTISPPPLVERRYEVQRWHHMVRVYVECQVLSV